MADKSLPAEPKRRVPKGVAVIHADSCTGCEACVAVCPEDAIELIATGLCVKGSHAWCEVDLERCVGCALCVRIPQHPGETYQLKICPWDAIELVPTEYLPQAVMHLGGPPSYVQEHRERLLAKAQRLATARRVQQSRVDTA